MNLYIFLSGYATNSYNTEYPEDLYKLMAFSLL